MNSISLIGGSINVAENTSGDRTRYTRDEKAPLSGADIRLSPIDQVDISTNATQYLSKKEDSELSSSKTTKHHFKSTKELVHYLYLLAQKFLQLRPNLNQPYVKLEEQPRINGLLNEIEAVTKNSTIEKPSSSPS